MTKGFVEEWRIKHLVHKDGFLRRARATICLPIWLSWPAVPI
jgi:hypothetical protein